MNKINYLLKLIISINILFLFILNNNYSTSNDDLDSYRISLPCAGCHSVKKDNLIVGTPPAGRGAGGTNTITIESWRHVF